MIDWAKLFTPTLPILEIVVRGTAVYLALFILLRLIAKREPGALGLQDLLLIVLIADAAQNAMAGEYKSITDGVILVLTLIFWNYALDWLEYHSPAFQKLVSPPPLPLIREGKMLRRNMRRELITDKDLMAQVREQGIEDLAEVKTAFMEHDGRISVIKRSQEQSGGGKRREPGKA